MGVSISSSSAFGAMPGIRVSWYHHACLGQAEHFSKRELGIYLLFAAAKNHSWRLRVVVLAVGGRSIG